MKTVEATQEKKGGGSWQDNSFSSSRWEWRVEDTLKCHLMCGKRNQRNIIHIHKYSWENYKNCRLNEYLTKEYIMNPSLCSFRLSYSFELTHRTFPLFNDYEYGIGSFENYHFDRVFFPYFFFYSYIFLVGNS